MNTQRLHLLLAVVITLLALVGVLILLGGLSGGLSPAHAQNVTRHVISTKSGPGDCSNSDASCRTGRHTAGQLAEVTISGPTTGTVNIAYIFTCTIGPITSTLPITYVWQATEQPSATHTSDLSDTALFTWNTIGTKGITVTAINAEGAITGTHVITIDAGSGSGGDNVIESRPILNVSPSVFLDGPESTRADHQARKSPALVSLEDVLPVTGPLGTTAVPYTPNLALAITDVVSARAIDFVHDEAALVKGVVVGIETRNDVYEHDHAVCSRFHGYTVDTIAPVFIPGPSDEPAWFWYVSEHKGALLEEVFTFAIFVDESDKRFTVDSRWRWDDYQSTPLPDHDAIYNLQIWAPSAADAQDLVRRTLGNLAAFDGGSWALDFACSACGDHPARLANWQRHPSHPAQSVYHHGGHPPFRLVARLHGSHSHHPLY
jgi:hypothetical protein